MQSEESNTLVKLAKAVIEHAPEGSDAFWDIKFSDIEAALSAAEPVCCGKPVHVGSPEAYTLECCEKFIQPAPSVAVKALADAYKAGFDASSQGYNGEVFPEYEADSEWLAQRDSDLSALSAQVQDVAASPADQIIGQIEELFPNWRSYRDLVDCITCEINDLRQRAEGR